MSCKIFLNMVIHDMRNPSGAISFAAKELQQILGSHFKKLSVLKKALQKVQPFIQPEQPVEELKEEVKEEVKEEEKVEEIKDE